MRLTATLLLALVLGVSPTTAGDECGFGGWGSTCSVTNSGSQVEIGASTTSPGSPAGPSGTAGGAKSPPEATVDIEEDCGLLGCRPGYTVVTFPDVTIGDLAAFRPASPSLQTEPAGFAVVGLPSNLVAQAPAQTLQGTLLGWEVSVRFTPAGFVLDHGDGTTSQTASGGVSWASLGLPQFSPTATSHVYRDRGEVTARTTVHYSAAVDFGTGWRPVPGYVTATSDGHRIRVVEAATALVRATCDERPHGPGC
ncbi:hypothetical protein ACFQZV_10580 [Microbacterium koreense]|uniref:Uncharacterized protein n=1 Tax=Microbacterium koreense TaxID=323761 RepID=A0ABW2ZSV6_9MICO